MSSIIEGYNYDIFISYRQKDNKYDGWVTEFVDNLRKELEATFKEEVSLYFDINPHDGLLETHDVRASLEDKLRCLIFIPIISRTYCDPKSFAWEHEFKAFVEMALKDQYGLKVKVPNGNVASRVLPVRIHELDRTDIRECEEVLKGPLRGIEFIYKAAGVNRPLRLKEEKPQENLNFSIYRDQINKVANSVKEIISGIQSGLCHSAAETDHKNRPESAEDEIEGSSKKTAFSHKIKIVSLSGLVFLLIVFGIIEFPEILPRDPEKRYRSEERISVVVLPFQNLTNDTSKNYLSQGIQELITSFITNENIIPVQNDGVIDFLERNGIKDYTSPNPKVVPSVTRNLNADFLISGSIIGAGPEFRLTAECTDFRTSKTIQSFSIVSSASEAAIISSADSLCLQIRDYLLITLLRKELSPNLNYKGLLTNSPEALRAFTEGMESYRRLDFKAAKELFETALKSDSNFIMAMIHLAGSYNQLASDPSADNVRAQKQVTKWRRNAYKRKELLTGFDRLFVECYCSPSIDQSERLKMWRLMKEKYEYPAAYYNIGYYYLVSGQPGNAVPELEKSLQTYEQMGVVPWLPNYLALGRAYRETEQIDKAERIYELADKYYPDNERLIYNQAVMKMIAGNSDEAERFIAKFCALYNDSLLSYNLARLYFAAGNIDKAEEYFNKSLLAFPRNPIIMNNMAYFLINTKRDIIRGLELSDSTLAIDSLNYSYMETKGWGLYRQEKYKEALDIMLKAMDLRKVYDAYNPIANWHIDSVRKAIEILSNNVH